LVTLTKQNQKKQLKGRKIVIVIIRKAMVNASMESRGDRLTGSAD